MAPAIDKRGYQPLIDFDQQAIGVFTQHAVVCGWRTRVRDGASVTVVLHNPQTRTDCAKVRIANGRVLFECADALYSQGVSNLIEHTNEWLIRLRRGARWAARPKRKSRG